MIQNLKLNNWNLNSNNKKKRQNNLNANYPKNPSKFRQILNKSPLQIQIRYLTIFL